MALQGTIDSFAMADVLRLLAASAKSGRLIVNGDRGAANLWLAEGRLVGGGSPEPVGGDVGPIVFDVLRFGAGSFIFEADAICATPSTACDVHVVLAEAEAALAEWNEIVKVVPSSKSWVTLAAELPHPEVVVDQACWASIVAVGGGTSVAELGASLLLDELPTARLVRALAEAGFVDVDLVAPATLSQPATSGDAFEYQETPVLADLPMRHPMGLDSDLDTKGFGDFDGAFGGVPIDDDDAALPSLTVAGLSDELYEPIGGLDAPSSAEELSRSMSMLSSKAAQALASLQDGGGGSQLEAEGVDEDEERTRMLRFLGSV